MPLGCRGVPCSFVGVWGESKPPRFLGTFCNQVSTFASQKPAYAVRISFRCQVPRRRQINRFPIKSDINQKLKPPQNCFLNSFSLTLFLTEKFPRRKQINRFPMKSDYKPKTKTTTKLLFELFLPKRFTPTNSNLLRYKNTLLS